MTPNKILLFGKNGQLGRELQRSLASLGEVVALDRHSETLCGDLKNSAGITETIKRVAPQIIVNAAAYTAVDAAETHIEEAFAINATAVGILAKSAREQDALFVHYSSDYVFNGEGTRPWIETDTPEPINIYGKSKFAGERAIIESGCKYLIFRTSWIYSAHGNNFVKTILRLASEKEKLEVVNDQIGAPTSADLLADISANCIAATIEQPHLEGLYHVAANGEVSWYQYAITLLNYARKNGVKLKINTENIAPVCSADFKTFANRPKNSRLCTTKFQSAFGADLPPWNSALPNILAQIIAQELALQENESRHNTST